MSNAQWSNLAPAPAGFDVGNSALARYGKVKSGTALAGITDNKFIVYKQQLMQLFNICKKCVYNTDMTLHTIA